MPADLETFAYARLDKSSTRELPWHRSGTEVDDYMTSREAIVAGGLDWKVLLSPALTRLPVSLPGLPATEHITIPIPDTFAVYRDIDRKVFGPVGRLFTPFQNEEWLEFGDAIVEEYDGAKWDTVGAIRGGKTVFASFRFDQVDARINDIDPHVTYLLMSNSHDGSASAKVAIVRVRTVCTNTHSLALRSASNIFTLRHIGGWKNKVEAVRAGLGIITAHVAEFDAMVEKMASTKLELDLWDKLVEELVPLPAKRGIQTAEDERGHLRSVLKFSPRIDESIRATNWGAFNAVTEWASWVRDERPDKRTPVREKALVSTMFGGAVNIIRDKAFARLSV